MELPTPSGLEKQVIEVLKTIYDPEIPVDIYELGLIYHLTVCEAGQVYLQMTLTAPGCPVAGSLPAEVETAVRCIPGVTEAVVELVWEPAWNPALMSEAAQLKLGFF
ncbi:DUF59 domain-containing protein [Anthocerotibacter panamensis]|uniref:DUF59 domain-containing protein n=1 Tax=Anthocerotibacter panamensis TaxID=2857077 RepID=UPI001C4016F2|nr:DUF59 domain-containing protein [Anthocerotibacter panamensis]